MSMGLTLEFFPSKHCLLTQRNKHSFFLCARPLSVHNISTMLFDFFLARWKTCCLTKHRYAHCNHVRSVWSKLQTVYVDDFLHASCAYLHNNMHKNWKWLTTRNHRPWIVIRKTTLQLSPLKLELRLLLIINWRHENCKHIALEDLNCKHSVI